MILGVNPDNRDDQIFAFYDAFNRSIPVAGVVAIRANIIFNSEFFVCAMPANTRVFAEICRELLAVLCQDIFPKNVYIDNAKTPFIVVNILFDDKSCIVDVRNTVVNTLLWRLFWFRK